MTTKRCTIVIMKVISIDPGYERVGIAIIEKLKLGEVLLFSECFRTSPKISHGGRLRLIGEEIERVIDEFQPDTMAIETLFFNDNQKTAMAVSEARGVVIYEGARKGLTVREFTPLEIKMAVTSYGRSDKQQVIEMVKRLIIIPPSSKKLDDEYDAIAVGLTCFAYEKANSIGL